MVVYNIEICPLKADLCNAWSEANFLQKVIDEATTLFQSYEDVIEEDIWYMLLLTFLLCYPRAYKSILILKQA